MRDIIEIAPEDLREAARAVEELKGECEDIGRSLEAEIEQAMSLLPVARAPEYQGRATAVASDLGKHLGPELARLARDLEERAKAAEEAHSDFLQRASLGLQTLDNLVLKPGERWAERAIDRRGVGRERARADARKRVAGKVTELNRLGQELRQVPAGAEARLRATKARLEKQFEGAMRAASRDLEAAESGLVRAERDLERATVSKAGHGGDRVFMRARDAENRMLRQQRLVYGAVRHLKDVEHDFAHDTDRATIAARAWAARCAGDVESLMRRTGAELKILERTGKQLGAEVSHLKVMGWL